MNKLRILSIAMLLTGFVVALPVYAQSPQIPTIPDTISNPFCDGDLNNLIGFIKPSFSNDFGAWVHGDAPNANANYGLYDGFNCWSYSGSLDATGTDFAFDVNPVQAPFVPATVPQCIEYQYCLAQTFSHPANQVVDIGAVGLTILGNNQHAQWLVCYASVDQGLPNNCQSGTISGGEDIFITLPISGVDTLNISGINMAIQYVHLGTNDLTPTTIPSNTPTPTATTTSSVDCGYIIDCAFSSLPGTWQYTSGIGHSCNNSVTGVLYPPYLNATCQSQTRLYESPASYSPSTGDTITIQYHAGYAAPSYNGDQVQASFALGSSVHTEPVINDASCPITTGGCLYTWTLTVNSAMASEGGLSQFSLITLGDFDNIAFIKPTMIITPAGGLPTNTDTPTVTPLPTGTPTRTPISYDGTPAHTPTPTIFAYTATAIPTPTGTQPTSTPCIVETAQPNGWVNFVPCGGAAPTPCAGVNDNCNSPTNSCQNTSFSWKAPDNLAPNGIASLPILGGIIQATLWIVVGGWNLIGDLFIPQHITCDFMPLTNVALTKAAIPDLSTAIAPLQTIMTTPCGYLGVKNIGFPRPKTTLELTVAPTTAPGMTPGSDNFIASQPISIGVDGCAAPWITYLPLGRSMINFAMWVWFVASTLFFIKSFFTSKSFE